MTIISTMYPQDLREGLILAGKNGDHAAIDRITDQLVDQGLARPRSDTSLFPPEKQVRADAPRKSGHA